MLKSTTASTRAEDGEEDEEVEGKSKAGEEDAMASTESERVGGGGCFGCGGGGAAEREGCCAGLGFPRSCPPLSSLYFHRCRVLGL